MSRNMIEEHPANLEVRVVSVHCHRLRPVRCRDLPSDRLRKPRACLLWCGMKTVTTQGIIDDAAKVRDLSKTYGRSASLYHERGRLVESDPSVRQGVSMSDRGWFTSSFTNGTGSCVEVKFDHSAVLVRDTKNRRDASGSPHDRRSPGRVGDILKPRVLGSASGCCRHGCGF